MSEELQNREPAQPQAPSAPQPQTPPPEGQASQPAPPVRRVGTLTMGLALIVVGAVLCALHFGKQQTLLLTAFRLSPLILVALGGEVLYAAVRGKNARLKYDFLSMFVCFVLIVAAFAASCIPLVVEYAGPARQAAETRVSQALSDAVYERLKGNPDVVDINFHVYLTYQDSYDAVRTGDDLKAGDWVSVTADLNDDFADAAAFVAACRPVLDAVRAQGLPGMTLYCSTNGQPGRDNTRYALNISGAYMPEMTDAQLADHVTEQVYVAEADRYMDAAEAAAWERGQEEDAAYAQIEELQRRLDESEERCAALQEEADASLAEANDASEERIAALQAEVAELQSQLETARDTLDAG